MYFSLLCLRNPAEEIFIVRDNIFSIFFSFFEEVPHHSDFYPLQLSMLTLYPLYSKVDSISFIEFLLVTF